MVRMTEIVFSGSPVRGGLGGMGVMLQGQVELEVGWG